MAFACAGRKHLAKLHLLRPGASAEGASAVTVFVSYSSRDSDAVKSLTQDLQDADEQVWMDQRLAGGEAWWRAILEQVRGCDVFIFALSQNSIESKPCQAELQYAQALDLPVLPVQVGPVDSMSLNPLATVQAIDYRHPTPSIAMRLSGALHRERAQRQPLPEPLPPEPPVPFEYLVRLYTTISNPAYLTPPDQAAVVAQLQLGLREDGQHEAARNDIVTLLRKLHDREDVTYRTRTEVEAILTSVGAEPGPQPPVGTDITPVESPIVDSAEAALETWATSSAGTTVAPKSAEPTEAAESSVAGTQLRRSDQSSLDTDSRDASQKPTVEQKPPPWRQRTVTRPPASSRHLVGAAIIDAFPILILYGIAFGVAAVIVGKSCAPAVGTGWRTVCGAHMNASGLAAIVIGLLVALAYSIWNWGYRQGTTGATIGNSVLEFKVLSEETGQPVGFGAKRIINVVALALVVLVPLSGAVTLAAAHIAGPDYYDLIQ